MTPKSRARTEVLGDGWHRKAMEGPRRWLEGVDKSWEGSERVCL